VVSEEEVGGSGVGVREAGTRTSNGLPPARGAARTLAQGRGRDL